MVTCGLWLVSMGKQKQQARQIEAKVSFCVLLIGSAPIVKNL